MSEAGRESGAAGGAAGGVAPTGRLRPADLGIGRLFWIVRDAVVIADAGSGRIVLWNPAAETLFGYAPDEIVGRQIEVLMPERLRARHRAALAIFVATGHGPLTSTGQPVELPALRKDGTEITIELALNPLVDESGGTARLAPSAGAPQYVHATIRDVTERVRVQAALRRSESRFRGAFEASAAGMALVRPDGRFLQANGALCDLLGYAEAELLTTDAHAVTHPDDAAEDDAVLSGVLASRSPRPYRRERRFVRKDGGVVWGLTTATLVHDADGAPLHFVVQVLDVTERRRAEEALRDANAALGRANAGLASANGELEQFAYTVSHDLKAPLVSIQGFAHRLALDHAGSLDAAGRRYLERIRANAVRLADLIDAVLAYSRVGRVGEPVAPVDLGAALRRSLEGLEELAERAGATVRAAGTLPVVVASPTLVDQILDNLLANALTYGVSQGERPDTAPAVEVGCDDLGLRWRLWVRDHGPGVPRDHQDRLFRLFERLPAGAAAAPGGTGVGLATVRKAAQALGGAAGVDSAAGAGATFWVEFPKVSEMPAASDVSGAPA